MRLEHVGLFVAFGLAIFVCFVAADDVEADVQIVSSGPCSHVILDKKGISSSGYTPKVLFDPKKVQISPRRPKVPGCFRIKANNVTITSQLHAITAEFEMHVGANADPSQPSLKCRKRQPKCGCGEKDSCMYCDFCKNIKKFVQSGELNNNDINMQTVQDTCDCNVPPGTYSFDVEVCTPDEQELSENVPTEVINKIVGGSKTPFSIFTTIYLYDFRYNSLADESQTAVDALKKRKARGLIGCYVVGANVNVD